MVGGESPPSLGSSRNEALEKNYNILPTTAHNHRVLPDYGMQMMLKKEKRHEMKKEKRSSSSRRTSFGMGLSGGGKAAPSLKQTVPKGSNKAAEGNDTSHKKGHADNSSMEKLVKASAKKNLDPKSRPKEGKLLAKSRPRRRGTRRVCAQCRL